MAINAYFFDSIAGDRTYSAGDFADAFNTFLQTGVVPDETGYYGLTVTGAQYDILNPGKAVIEGHFVDVPTSESITDIPVGTYDGMIVLRLDTTGDRNCTVRVRNDRIPQQDPSVWELPLYNVVVTNGVITSATDIRTGGGALAQLTSKLRSVSDAPIIMKKPGHKSWSIQRLEDESLYFVPSSSVDGEDWDFTDQVYITEAGSLVASGNVYARANLDVTGTSTLGSNLTMSRDATGIEFRIISIADDNQMRLKTTANGGYLDCATSNYSSFKKFFIRAPEMQTTGFFSTTGQESGFCGVGARVMDDVTFNVAGVGVSFRQRRVSVPNSITLAPLASNTSVATVTGSMITNEGFWLAINGLNTGAPTYLYWRGTYTTN